MPPRKRAEVQPAPRPKWRFIAKPHTRDGKRVWGVYDRDIGSWPVHRPGVGEIAQDFPDEAGAKTEAHRVEQYYNNRKESS